MGFSLSDLDPTQGLSYLTGGAIGGDAGKGVTDILNPEYGLSVLSKGEFGGSGGKNSDFNPRNWIPENREIAGTNVGNAIKHPFDYPLSFSTGGLLGGDVGIFETPDWARKLGASPTNSLVSGDPGGNRNLGIGALFTGYGLAGGYGAGASTVPSTAAPVADSATPLTDYTMADAATTEAAGGGATAASEAPYIAGAANGGAAATGMSTAQKIALGLAGVNAVAQKAQGLNPDLMAGATPAQTTSNKILDQYNSGQLNAADQYSIAIWAQDSKAKKQQYYAQAGLSDSSMATQDIAQIDAQAGAMRDQALQNMLQGGLNAAGIANTATGRAVDLQIQQDQQAQQAQRQFFEMLALTLA